MADQNVIRAFLRAINTAKASPREAKALFEAGIVESGLRNLNYGDRDSKGALQQRASTGWQHATDPYRAALDFLAHARQANSGGSAGQLAQSVQRSAFPGRYDQNASQAARFLQGNPGVATGRPGSTTTTTDTTSLTPDAQQARRSALAQFVLSSGAGDPLKLAQAYAGAGSQTQTTRKVRTTGGAIGGAVAGSSGYVNPFGPSLKAPGRVDEGVDPVIQGPIRAIGDARVVNISHNFYKGQPYIVYQLTSGPHKGRYVYVSELVTPHVAVGQRLRAGDVVATGHGAIETGWAGGATGSYLPLANRAQGGNYTEGKATGHGQAFAQFLRSLGANAAR